MMFEKVSQNFVRSPLKVSLLTDFSPQLMACMLQLVSLNSNLTEFSDHFTTDFVKK